MAIAQAKRRLAAIMAADIVGYSRLIEEDEAGTLAAIKDLRRVVIDPLLAERHGRIVKLMGDGAIVEFGSVVDAVACALAIQKNVAERQAGVPPERRIVFRIGVNLGDVVVEGEDLLGDGVNVAARLEQLCEPGGVLVSGTAYDHLQGKLDCGFEDLGERQLKNIARPVRVYRVTIEATSATSGPAAAPPLSARPVVAVLPLENMSGDPEQAYFSDGISEDVITELARFRELMVIARNSSFAFRGKAVDVREVGRALGAGYVVEGSVRRAGERVRITAQLIDATHRHAPLGGALRPAARGRVRDPGRDRARHRRDGRRPRPGGQRGRRATQAAAGHARLRPVPARPPPVGCLHAGGARASP